MQSSKSKKLAALEELKNARAQGKPYRQRVDDLIPSIYDEVNEDEYQAKRADCRQFVENDNGIAYDDTDSDRSGDDNESLPREKKAKKGKSKQGTIMQHFQQKPRDERAVCIDDDETLNDLLQSILATDERQSEIPPPYVRIAQKRHPKTPPRGDSSPPTKKPCFQVQASIPIAKKTSAADIGENSEEEGEETFIEEEGEETFIEGEGEETFMPLGNTESTESIGINTESIEIRNQLKFFLVDAFEDPHNRPGVVYFFGHVKSQTCSETGSCCLILRNIDRQIFFVRKGAASIADLKTEVEVLLLKLGVAEFKSKVVTKNFVNVPDGACEQRNDREMLEVWIRKIPMTLPSSGKYFSHVLNTTASPLERLLMQREIHSPCWIDVHNVLAVSPDSHISYCRFEYVVDMSKNIQNISMDNNSPDSIPNLRIMALNVAMGHPKDSREQQIVMISAIYHEKCNIGRNPLFYNTKDNQEHQFCVMTKLKTGALPYDIKSIVKTNKKLAPYNVDVVGNEISLLNKFLFKLNEIDPDIILSHDLSGQLAILLHRLEHHNKKDRLGRLKATKALNIGHNKSGLLKSVQWEFTAGRLSLDSKMAASEMVHARSYDLNEMAVAQLKKKHEALDIEQITEHINSQKPLTKTGEPAMGTIGGLICWNAQSARLALELVQHLNAIPLYVQITQIVGGVLSRTLLGGRAERNEYLLLHACHKQNYIAPDKFQSSKQAAKKIEEKSKKTKRTKKNNVKKTQTSRGNATFNDSSMDDINIIEEEDGIMEVDFDDSQLDQSQLQTQQTQKTPAATTNRKAQYTGGLVLEPKRGLYETYIILLDFNSLYPSIIQEFNICFTTVESAFDDLIEADLPTPPGSSRPDGILKTEIHKLVSLRRDVKRQMATLKSQLASERPNSAKFKQISDKYQQCEIRQKGLKLTANSMYGCLGFPSCRFYAKTLAAMITAKGRELLLHAKSIVESENHPVVYGDTDSLMVDSTTTDFDQAKQIGEKIKQVVNKNYRLLELDIDGIYKRLLLLKKKKYAALAVNPATGGDEHAELKGLDIVRRDWSELAKDVGEYVVKLILSPTLDRDTLVIRILELLSDIRRKLDAGDIEPAKFEILKQLTRSPSDYKDVKGQPHALVAIRLNECKKFSLRQGDIVHYIICKDGTNNPATQRAYHISEITSDRERLSIDLDYYLTQQIHPVVTRLCEPIEEVDGARIAEAIGINPEPYRHRYVQTTNATTNEFGAMDDEDVENNFFHHDFSACDGISIECFACKTMNVVRSLAHDRGKNFKLSLEECTHCGANFINQANSVKTQLLSALNHQIRCYLQSPYVCDDVTCAAECFIPAPLQMLESGGVICLRCQSGTAKKAYSSRRLYDQQCFFKSILDLKECTVQENAKLVERYDHRHKELKDLYSSCLELVERKLELNAFGQVDLGSVFSIAQYKKKSK